MTICIVDTSILLELLNVPGCAADHDAIVADFAERQKLERFLLPIAVVVETGNHVAHVRDGDARRRSAEDFVAFARKALAAELPFVPTPLPSGEDILEWLDDFPEYAMRKIGLADRSLIALWDAQRELQPHRRVYIWSLDDHLKGCDTAPPEAK